LQQLVRPVDRQHAQHDCINEAEGGRISAYPEGQRKHSDDGEARRVAQYAEAEAQILPKCLHGYLLNLECPGRATSIDRYARIIDDKDR
jgi:hypothetical protein